MKAQFVKHIQSLGGTCSYSGKKKTMFIHENKTDGIPAEEIEYASLLHFGYKLPFKIQAD